ncbi:MAG: hypothetical protein NXI31_09780 [bacterium]|nr:hypothetical protein [bacterium]
MSTTGSDVRDRTVANPVPAATNAPAADPGYVLPKPGQPGQLVLPGGSGSGLRRYREAAVASAIGDRVGALLECQQRFLGELRSSLQEVEDGVAEAGRARLQAQIKSALSVLEWCDAVQRDLTNECDWAAQGLQPLDLVAYCDDVASEWSASERTVHVSGQVDRPWWGDAGRFAEAFEAGLALVAERSQDAGTLTVEVEVRRDVARVRIAAAGEPTTDLDPAVVRTFRQAAERLGALIQPDQHGPGGCGLVLVLPRVEA